MTGRVGVYNSLAMATIKLAAGLGNPGDAYAGTRHNAGVWFVDGVAGEVGVDFSNKSSVGGGLAVTGGVRLLKPNTFMNESGQSVGAAARYFGIAPEEVLVAHDEVDLPPGAARLKFGGGDAGHRGLRDVSRALGGRDYWRLRIGVGNGVGGAGDYVLRKPPAAERELIDNALRRATAVWDTIAAGDMQKAMLILHTAES